MDKYEIINMEISDFGMLCIGNKETDRVLCHFVCDSKDERESNVLIANDIAKYLNEREALLTENNLFA